MLGGFTNYDDSLCTHTSDGNVTGNCERHLATLDGGLFLALIVVVSVLLSVRSMQRRDVP